MQNCAIFAAQKSNQCEGDSEALSPIAEKDPTGCKRSAAKKRRFIFFGAGERGNPFSFAQTSDFENLGNIREKENLRNRESTESSVDSESKAENLGNTEILNNEQKQSPSGVEPSTDSESSSTDSQTNAQSTKEILNNAQRQNLGSA